MKGQEPISCSYTFRKKKSI